MSTVAVASSSQLAVDVGIGAGAAGGNAVDAALSAMLVSLVTEPGICSLGGGAYVTVWPVGRPAEVVDGGCASPRRHRGRGEVDAETITTAYAGGVTTTVGYGSAATPGAVAALDTAARRHGALPWRRLVEPAIAIARAGFALSAASDHYLEHVHESIYGRQTRSRDALHHPDGGRLRRGETVRVDGLADSLESIAEHGAAAMHRGELAERIADDMDAHGGLVTAEDLAGYEPVVRPALGVDVDGWRIATNPPPAVGGAALAAVLSLTRGHPDGPWTAGDVAAHVAAQRAVLTYRRQHLDAAEDRGGALAAFLSLVDGDPAALLGSPSTVHTSAVDEDGWACAITASAGYGSGVIAADTGIWMNNCLGELELLPVGLDGLEPGERLPSNMAPTTARAPDGAVLAIGSPGADRITTAIAQVLAGYVRGGVSLAAAVAQPRVHVDLTEQGPVVSAEHGAEMDEVALPVRAVDGIHMSFGGVGVAARRADGGLDAAADPRRDGAAGVG